MAQLSRKKEPGGEVPVRHASFLLLGGGLAAALCQHSAPRRPGAAVARIYSDDGREEGYAAAREALAAQRG